MSTLLAVLFNSRYPPVESADQVLVVVFPPLILYVGRL